MISLKQTQLRILSVAALSAVAACCSIAAAQAVKLPDDQAKQVEEAMEVAKQIGPWENQIPLIEDAADNIFQQQGWNSPEDQFARTVMRDVGRIPPWDPVARQDAFLNAVQSRWSLSHDQRSQLDTTVQREAMMMTLKHFKDVLPVMVDITRARASNQPFTPEQVQQWVTRLRPLIDESGQAIQRVTQQLDRTMTDDQRKQMQADLAAFNRRHSDVTKLVQKWQSGQWTPTDWGLQNDPVHAPVMAQYASRDANRDSLVAQAQLKQPMDDKRFATDETEWDKYVRQFCQTYRCDESQINQAAGILKNSKTEAINYRNGRKSDIEKLQQLLASATNPTARASHQADLDRLLRPINDLFERLKKQLTALLTTQQREQFGSPIAASGASSPTGKR